MQTPQLVSVWKTILSCTIKEHCPKCLNATAHSYFGSSLLILKKLPILKNFPKITMPLQKQRAPSSHHFLVVKCFMCIVEVEGKKNWWEQLSRLFSFSFLSTSFRLPSLHSPHTLFGVGNTEYTASKTSHVETSCLQAGGCSVKGEKTSFSVGEEKISWISRDGLIPKCLLCLHKHLWTSAK